jgi:hypothetical protein
VTQRDVALAVDEALKDARPNGESRGRALKYKDAAVRVIMASEVPPVAAQLG